MLINGEKFKNAVISGANNITNYKKAVDELNVFPVPDGDTGTNMSMTIRNASKELMSVSDKTALNDVSKMTSDALLRGARGNSGVILSLLFRGISKGLSQEKDSADGQTIAKALEMGVEAAYKAVMQPTEGTILTVARLAAEKAKEVSKENNDALYVWNEVVKAANIALESTPDLLPVLKKAGVVDAGGKGLCLIFEGMNHYFNTQNIIELNNNDKITQNSSEVSTVSHVVGEFEADIKFAYCTEFIVNRENENDPLTMRAYFESIGDSVVVVDDEEIIKVHLHTNEPGNALQEGLKFGSLTTIKIENMREQHTSKILEVQKSKEYEEYVPVNDEIEYGFVSVAAGEGIKQLFTDLGCNHVVSGGQTMNPSTDDILNAIHATPAKTVFVLPNNKNIIMAAEQAVPLADRKVIVLPTVTIPQGISAMLAFDPDNTALDNQIAMNDAVAKVSTGQITFAARDADYDGHKIKKDEILALANNKLSFVGKDLNQSVLKLTKSLLNKNSGFVTLIYGRDVTTEQAEELQKLLKNKLSNNLEIMLISGGQPVYYYIISVE